MSPRGRQRAICKKAPHFGGFLGYFATAQNFARFGDSNLFLKLPNHPGMILRRFTQIWFSIFEQFKRIRVYKDLHALGFS
jgi:hypothetical protein